MDPSQVRRLAVQAAVAVAAGAAGGYLAALVRPRPPTAYASNYLAPTPHVPPSRDAP